MEKSFVVYGISKEQMTTWLLSHAGVTLIHEETDPSLATYEIKNSEFALNEFCFDIRWKTTAQPPPSLPIEKAVEVFIDAKSTGSVARLVHEFHQTFHRIVYRKNFERRGAYVIEAPMVEKLPDLNGAWTIDSAPQATESGKLLLSLTTENFVSYQVEVWQHGMTVSVFVPLLEVVPEDEFWIQPDPMQLIVWLDEAYGPVEPAQSTGG